MKFIVITLIVVSLIIVTYIYMQKTAPNIEKYIQQNSTNFADLLGDNGDIILLSGDTPGERTCRWCTGSIFSHVGFLFREIHPETKEDILYITDCDIGQGTKEGSRVMVLSDKLKRYKGFKIGAIKKLQGRRPTTEEIMNVVSKYTHTDFDHIIATWWVADVDFLYYMVKNNKKMFCGEYVAKLMKELNILKKEGHPAGYVPRDFDLNKLNLEDGYSYGETTFFRF